LIALAGVAEVEQPPADPVVELGVLDVPTLLSELGQVVGAGGDKFVPLVAVDALRFPSYGADAPVIGTPRVLSKPPFVWPRKCSTRSDHHERREDFPTLPHVAPMLDHLWSRSRPDAPPRQQVDRVPLPRRPAGVMNLFLLATIESCQRPQSQRTHRMHSLETKSGEHSGTS
jgi:hypothetical protein